MVGALRLPLLVETTRCTRLGKKQVVPQQAWDAAVLCDSRTSAIKASEWHLDSRTSAIKASEWRLDSRTSAIKVSEWRLVSCLATGMFWQRNSLTQVDEAFRMRKDVSIVTSIHSVDLGSLSISAFSLSAIRIFLGLILETNQMISHVCQWRNYRNT